MKQRLTNPHSSSAPLPSSPLQTSPYAKPRQGQPLSPSSTVHHPAAGSSDNSSLAAVGITPSVTESSQQTVAVQILEEKFREVEQRMKSLFKDKEVQEVEHAHLQAEVTRLSALLAAAQEREAGLEEKVRMAMAACREKESALDSRAQQVAVLEQSLAAAREQSTHAVGELQACEERAKKLLQEYEGRVADVRKEHELLVTSLEATAEASSVASRDLSARMEGMQANMRELQLELVAKQAALSDAERTIEHLQPQLRELQDTVDGLRTQLEESEKREASHSARILQLTAELNTCQEERAMQAAMAQEIKEAQKSKVVNIY